MKKLILILFLFAIPIWAGDAEEIIEELQQKYENIQYLKIEFNQVTHFKLSGIENISSGVMFIGTEDRFRLETEERTIVTDGVTIWSYSPLNNQLVIDKAKKSGSSILPREFLFSYSEKYDPFILKEYEEKDIEWAILKLTPKPQFRSAVRYIKIWVRMDKWLVSRIDYVDLNGNTTTFDVKKLTEPKSLPAKTFDYKAPEGTAIIDLTKKHG